MLHADLDTLAQVRVVLADAAARGADAAESLDRAGLLWFPARMEALRVDTVNHVAQVLDAVQIKQVAQALTERMPTTPLDAKRVLVTWLRKVAAQ